MTPAAFWRLHPDEFWLIYEAHQQPKMFGKMNESEVAALYRDAYGDDVSRPNTPLHMRARR